MLLAQGRGVIDVEGAVVTPEDEQRPPVGAEGHRYGPRPDRQLEAGDRGGAAQQSGQQRALRLLTAIQIDGFAREQHREVDPRFDHGLGPELVCERNASLGRRVLFLHQRDDPGDQGDDQQQGDPGKDTSQPAGRAPSRASACPDKLPLDRAQLIRC